MKDLKTLIIIGLTIIILFLFMCNKPKIVTKEIEVFRTDSIHITDTIIDTIKFETKSIKYINNYIDLRDTIKFNKIVNTYHYGEKDSLLKYDIYIKGDSKPLDVQMKYDVLQFKIKDSIYVKDSVHTKDLKSSVSLGVTLLGSKNNFGFSPQLLYNHKRGISYGLGYDLINNNLSISFYKKVN